MPYIKNTMQKRQKILLQAFAKLNMEAAKKTRNASSTSEQLSNLNNLQSKILANDTPQNIAMIPYLITAMNDAINAVEKDGSKKEDIESIYNFQFHLANLILHADINAFNGLNYMFKEVQTGENPARLLHEVQIKSELIIPELKIEDTELQKNPDHQHLLNLIQPTHGYLSSVNNNFKIIGLLFEEYNKNSGYAPDVEKYRQKEILYHLNNLLDATHDTMKDQGYQEAHVEAFFYYCKRTERIAELINNPAQEKGLVDFSGLRDFYEEKHGSKSSASTRGFFSKSLFQHTANHKYGLDFLEKIESQIDSLSHHDENKAKEIKGAAAQFVYWSIVSGEIFGKNNQLAASLKDRILEAGYDVSKNTKPDKDIITDLLNDPEINASEHLQKFFETFYHADLKVNPNDIALH